MVALSEKERAHASTHQEFERIQKLVQAHKAAASAEEEQVALAAIVSETPPIAVRSNWHRPGEPEQPSEYRILLSAGAPTVQIIGDLDTTGNPYTARLGYQDWFTRWDECELTEEEEVDLLAYACCFSYQN